MTGTEGRGPRKLVVFDVEGVLVPKNRFFFDVAKAIGITSLLKVLFLGFLYEVGLFPLKRTLQGAYKLTKGSNIQLLAQVMAKLPLMPNAHELCISLRESGYMTALISSGIPTFLVEKLTEDLGADYAIGVEVGVKAGVLTGEVWGDVTEPKGKFLVLKELLEEYKLCPNDCVIVVDDRNNASIFIEGVQKIGYNPDFIIRIKADRIVSGRLTKILPIINQEAKTKTWPSRNDLLREIIHSSGVFIPLLAIAFGVLPVAAFIGSVIALYCASEFSRIRGTNLPFFSTVTRHAASQSELREFALAPVYFAVGILLALLLFPAPASYAGIAVFALGDSAASLVGGAIGGKPLPFNRAKTLEGSAAGFFFAFLGAAVFLPPWIALVGAAVGMAVEYLPLPVNDNLLIPLISALAFTFLI